MNRKIVAISALVFSGLLLIASCSPKESSTTPTPSPVPTPTIPSTELPPSYYLPEIPRISIGEVKAKLDAGSNIVIIDTRHKYDYDLIHIGEAILISRQDIADHYDDLDGYDEIIIYCN
ncbi:rhodanese-like domain-containing protein [Chloroflexota bacterium]